MINCTPSLQIFKGMRLRSLNLVQELSVSVYKFNIRGRDDYNNNLSEVVIHRTGIADRALIDTDRAVL